MEIYYAIAPLLAAGLVAGGSSLLSSAFGAFSDAKTNAASRQWNEMMYERQKGDNLAQWHLQNEYNSPQSQMQRLRDAGLNANLVYGNGSAVQAASPVRGADVPAWSPRAPKIDFGGAVQSGLSAYYDMAVKTAQVDNVKANTTVANQQALKLAADTGNVGVQTARNTLELSKARELMSTSIDAAKADLRRSLIAEDQSALNLGFDKFYYPDRGQQMEAKTKEMQANAERARLSTEEVRENIERLRKDNRIKDFEIQLRANGVNSSDPMYYRLIAIMANKLGLNIR